jgi:2-C-methyl-D-erythritol 4-phosphate cytidylyltransferase
MIETLRLGIVVTAGGHGVRLGQDSPKQYVPILGIPMVQRTIAALDACPQVSALVVVVNDEDVPYCQGEIVAERFEKVLRVVGGGEERALSVRNGVRALAEAAPALELLGVHDGARPLVLCEDVGRLVERLARRPAGEEDEGVDGAILAVPSTDTVKLVIGEGLVTATPPRTSVWRAMTPQLFRRDTLLAAYSQPEDLLISATDDAQLVELMGGRVAVVEGSPENLKVTTPLDLRLAEQILADRRR